jgi:YHS domain-containing protein
MIRRALFACAAIAVGLTVTAFAADKIKLEGVKCVVAGSKPAKEGTEVDYKGAKVFFCCMNCPKAFKADTAKFAAKANQQLVATGQATQVKCPLTGEDIDNSTQITFGGAKVAFCCDSCKGKAEKATGDEQVNLIFADKAFDKGFKVNK